MVNAIGILLIVLGGIGVTILLAWLAVVVSNRPEEEENRDMFINFGTKITGGPAFGPVVSIETGAGNRPIITVDPSKEYDPKAYAKLKDKPKPFQVIVGSNKLVSVPKNKWCKWKNIHFGLPPNADDFPDDVKETEIGRMLMLGTEIKNSLNSEIKAFKDGSARKDLILENLGEAVLAKKFIKKHNELLMQILEDMAKGKDKDKSSSYHVPTSSDSSGG